MLTASVKPTRLYIRNRVQVFSIYHSYSRDKALFVTGTNPSATGFSSNFQFSRLPKWPLWNWLSLSTEYTCSGVGRGYYLPISTLACFKGTRHKMCLHMSIKNAVFYSKMKSASSACSALVNIFQRHCRYWKIVEGECVLESVHLQRVEGTPCQSGGCSHTEGSESLRSGSCIIE